MARRLALYLLALAVVAVPLAGGTGATGPVERPPGATTDVEIRFGADGHGGAEASIRWAVYYPARSAAEAERAANDTLALDWFRGPEHVRAAVASHPGGRVTDAYVSTQHLQAEGTGHGEILVVARATWPDVFAGNRSRVVLGPAFADRLADGDELTVVVHRSWEAVSATTERTAVNEVQDRYRWTIGDGPTPRVVFDESVLDSGVPVLGPGLALALLALLVAAGLQQLRRRT